MISFLIKMLFCKLIEWNMNSLEVIAAAAAFDLSQLKIERAFTLCHHNSDDLQY